MSNLQKNEQNAPLLDAINLKKYYPVKQGMFKAPKMVKAVDGVSFTLERGKTLAVVGESGCGKSTLGRMLTMIEHPTEGELFYNGQNFLVNDKATSTLRRQKIQIVFQNPYSSLNPRKKVGEILEEPLIINTSLSSKARKEKVLAMMAKVGLKPEFYDRYPHMFSGGQRQRLSIARVIAVEPNVYIFDDSFSALDFKTDAKLRAVLAKETKNKTVLIVGQRINTIMNADKIIVLNEGKIVGQGTHQELMKDCEVYQEIAASQLSEDDLQKMSIAAKGVL